MTNEEIDNELKQLEKDYWDTLQRVLNEDVLVYPAVQEPRGVSVKKLTDAYYAKKLELESMKTGWETISMIYKCAAMSAQIGELGDVLYDFEFEGTDGSSLMLANVLGNFFELGCLYELSLIQRVPAKDGITPIINLPTEIQ